MLSPELKKLKEKLEGKDVKIDSAKLLNELQDLDKIPIKSINESLALSSGVCKSCGRPF